MTPRDPWRPPPRPAATVAGRFLLAQPVLSRNVIGSASQLIATRPDPPTFTANVYSSLGMSSENTPQQLGAFNMQTMDLPIHIPTAIIVGGILLSIWLLQFAVRGRRVEEAKPPDPKPKRGYTKKRIEPPEPVAQ